MRNVLLSIFKYLLWALLIIAALLYMDGFDLRQQALVLLIGIVAIDIVFAVAGLIYKGSSKLRKNKAKKAKDKKNAQKSKTSGDTVADTVKETGTAILGAAETTWGVIKEKGSEVSTAIKEKLNGE